MIHIFTTQKKKTIIMILTIFTLLLASAVIWSNSYIETENIIYSGIDIPEAFDGVKIVHLSDYHNHGGNYEDRLVSKIKSAEPDYIFLTGDQVDSYLTDTDNINYFFRKVSETATVRRLLSPEHIPALKIFPCIQKKMTATTLISGFIIFLKTSKKQRTEQSLPDVRWILCFPDMLTAD